MLIRKPMTFTNYLGKIELETSSYVYVRILIHINKDR